MSQSRMIPNPAGAGAGYSTDWRTGKTVQGGDVDLDQDIVTVRANAAIAVGQAVGLVLPTATVPPSGTPHTAAMTKRLYTGAAIESGAAGEYVQICVRGFCRINVGAGNPAAGDLAVVPATTTGVYDTTAVAPDATTVAGTIAGVVLGTKEAGTNLAFAYLDPK